MSSTDLDATQPSMPTLNLEATTRMLPDLADNSILVHSTNCFANWGAGFALALHDQYPLADLVYTEHCWSCRPSPDTWPAKDALVGTTLLIPPQAEKEGTPKVWIACLFTSYGYGRPTKKKAGKDSKAKIVSQTESALNDLRRQLSLIEEGKYEVGSIKQRDGIELSVLSLPNAVTASGPGVSGKASTAENPSNIDMMIYSPHFNSGSFGVKWEETEKQVEHVFKDWGGKWFVLAPPQA